MESDLVLQDYEPTAKRLKTDSNETISGELCSNQRFSGFSATFPSPIDHGKDLGTNCNSNNGDSLTIPSDAVESEEIPENLTESIFTSPTHEITDTSQEEEEEEEEDDDNGSTVSHLSELSGISNFSGHEWKPIAGSMIWIQQKMQKGVKPRNILNDLGVEKIPQYVDDLTLWKIIINMLAEPPRRHKLRHVNTLDDVVRLLKGAHKIIVLTGAGVSVSCGIPDFRSKDGIYSRLAKEFPNLPNPQAMFDINYFSQDPRPFFKFAKDIYPGKFKPSPCHRFIRLLEKNRKLLRNYTQNIDTLEKEAGIERAIECHGSFATATCTKCEHKVSADKIRDTVLNQKIPMCEVCNKGNIEISTDDLGGNNSSTNYKDLVLSGIMKPDIVFFGEGLPDTFHDAMASDKTECDLLLVIGSSLKVRPVALIPNSLPSPVPQILINREPLSHCHFDVELLGDCDVIISHLCRLLGENWEEGVSTNEELTRATELLQYNNNKESVSFDFNKWRANFPVNLQECNCTVENNEIPSSSKQQEKICSCNPSLEEEEGTNKLKERHISIDSARDSGIGENSNFADLENDKEPITFSLDQDSTSTESCSLKKIGIDEEEKTEDNLRRFWQPKVKKSLAERLPPKTFYLSPPNRYIFPGAEVFYHPDDKSSGLDEDDDDDESSSDTVSECC